MDIENMDIEDVKAELTGRGIKMHHKTNAIKLRKTLQDDVDKNDTKVPVEVESSPVQPAKAEKKSVKKSTMTLEEKCMHLKRIIVTPNDPELSGHSGLVFTVMVSAVNNGKAIKKYVPFNNEEGWHVPNVIVNQIANAEMQKFRSVKAPNGDTVLQPYQAKKYNVQVLPDLTQKEIDKLAAAQAARGDA
jgi:hypothetical protein